MKTTFRQFYEKTVIGLVEDIEIAGIGKVSAKVDSGNGYASALDAQDIDRQGNKVTFTTIGGKRLIKDVIEVVNINVGAGHIEERPVVLFRIKFGGVEFDNIPFSLANRSNNDHKVLIGREFIKQLDALIDVNAKNIANKQIEVQV